MSAPTYNGNPIPLFTVAPDWGAADPVLKVLHNTAIFEALDNSEERHKQRPRPLYGISFTSAALGQQQQGAIRKQLETAQDQVYGVPLWTEAISLSAAAASGSSSLDVTSSSFTLFQIFPYALLWRDWQTYELVELASAALETIFTLTAPTAGAWPEGTLLVPVAYGYLARPEFSAIDGDNARADIQFEERFLFNWQDRLEQPTVPTPTISYSACLDTVTVDFGDTIPNLKRYLVEVSDVSSDGPWDHYTYARRERSRLVFNNYFGGVKWLRISFVMLDLTVISGVYIFQPDAPSVAPPVISVSDLFDPTFALPANYCGASGVDGSTVLVTADQEQIDYNGAAILKIPCGEAFIEAGKREYKLNSWSDPQSPSTMAVDLVGPSGSTMKFTTDGSDPTLVHGSDDGDTINPFAVTFGLVVIARAFKDGCKSPPAYLLIDKNFGMTDRFTVTVGAIADVASCDLANWQKAEPSCEPSIIHRTCWAVYGSESPAEISATWFASLSGGPAGPSIPLTTYYKDIANMITGATTQPPGCGPGVNWSNGTLTMNAFGQTADHFNTGAQTDLASDLDQFPDCKTCVLIHQTNPDPAVLDYAKEILLPTWKDTLLDDFFGPTRNPTAFDGSGLSGRDAVGILKLVNEAILASQFINASLAFRIDNIRLAASLAPSNSPDLWNPDDVV